MKNPAKHPKLPPVCPKKIPLAERQEVRNMLAGMDAVAVSDRCYFSIAGESVANPDKKKK